MKRFLQLLKLEYDGMFLPLGIILGAMAVLQLVLFGWRLRAADAHAPLSYVIDTAGIYIVFAIAFAGILALTAARLIRNFMPSKSIYALLSLPIKRGHVYLAKLAATLLAGFMLLAAQMALLLAFSALMGMRSTDNIGFEVSRRNADLYLSLLDVSFLRMLFPPNLFSLMFSVFGYFGSVCVALYATVGFKAGRRNDTVFIAIFWLALMFFTFPLYGYSGASSLIKLIIMIVVILVACRKGRRLFESGEVAG